MKKTKIITTIGPATNESKKIAQLAKNGMDIVRINFSHGDKESLISIYQNTKEAEKIAKKTIGVLQDLQGPKIRTGDFKNGEIELKKGKEIKIFEKNILGDENQFSIKLKNLFKDLKVGDRIILNDGNQVLRVTAKNPEDKSLIAKVLVGGKIKNRRGVNFPDSSISISSLTKKDKEDLKWFAKKYQPDFIAFSFVKTPKDVLELRRILKKEKIDSLIIAKIETQEAIKNFDEILKLVDGIMVARGDLGVEFPFEEVPVLQKEIIQKTKKAGKPVIVATQMLESMIENPVPTRAEVSDIANAVWDGADATMLSAETGVGKYPEKAVKMMAKTILEAEKTKERKNILEEVEDEDYKIIPKYAVETAEKINAKVIVVFSETGFSAKNIAKFQSNLPVFVFSPNERVLRKTKIYYGLNIGNRIAPKNLLEAEKIAQEFLKKNKILKKGDKFVIMAGIPFRTPGNTNMIFVSKI